MELTVFEKSVYGRCAYKDLEGNIYLDCTRCKKVKEISFFSNHSGLLGKRGYCRQCKNHCNNEDRKQNPEKYREINRRSREKAKKKNPVAFNARERKYERVQRLNRKARDKGLPASLTQKALRAIMGKYDNKCALTGIPFPDIDHVIPLASGEGGSIVENILPIASHLNNYKRDLNVFEWAEQYHEFLGFTMERFNEVIAEVAERNGMTLDEYKDYVYWCFENKKDVVI